MRLVTTRARLLQAFCCVAIGFVLCWMVMRLKDDECRTPNTGRHSKQHELAFLPRQDKQQHLNNTPSISKLSRPRLCIAERLEHLGNRMFQHAVMFALSRSKNMTPLVLRDSELYWYFKVTAQPVNSSVICMTFRKHITKRDCAYDDESVSFSGNVDTALVGYFQSYVYFKDYFDKIRREFTFKSGILEKAKLVRLAEIFQTHPEAATGFAIVGIHIRRGDMSMNPYFVKYGYKVAPKEYFDRAMAAYRANYTRVIFVVVSTDVLWTSANIKGPDVVHSRSVSQEVDLAILSLCDHMIISVGTYGWWAGFLANGKTVYYKHPVSAHSKLSREFSLDYWDYFPPSWIPME